MDLEKFIIALVACCGHRVATIHCVEEEHGVQNTHLPCSSQMMEEGKTFPASLGEFISSLILLFGGPF